MHIVLSRNTFKSQSFASFLNLAGYVVEIGKASHAYIDGVAVLPDHPTLASLWKRFNEV